MASIRRLHHSQRSMTFPVHRLVSLSSYKKLPWETAGRSRGEVIPQIASNYNSFSNCTFSNCHNNNGMRVTYFLHFLLRPNAIKYTIFILLASSKILTGASDLPYDIIADHSAAGIPFAGISIYGGSLFAGTGFDEVVEIDLNDYRAIGWFQRKPVVVGRPDYVVADSNSVATIGSNNVYLWSRTNGDNPTVMETGSYAASVAMNDSVVVSTGELNLVNIWRRPSGQLIRRFNPRGTSSGTVRCAILMNNFLILADDQGVLQFDMAASLSVPVRSYTATSYVLKIAIDGGYIYGASYDNRVRTWALTGPTSPVGTDIQVPATISYGGLAVSQGNIFIGTNISPFEILQYNAFTGALVRRVGTHMDSIDDLQVYGNHLFTSGLDGVIKDFRIPELPIPSNPTTSTTRKSSTATSSKAIKTSMEVSDGGSSDGSAAGGQATVFGLSKISFIIVIILIGVLLMTPPIAFTAYIMMTQRLPWEEKSRSRVKTRTVMLSNTKASMRTH